MNRELDLALLRRFEPIVHFTHGEQFFPMDVEPFVESCSLWVQRPEQQPLQLVRQGRLSLRRLARPYFDEFGAVYFLKLTEPLGMTEMAKQTVRNSRLVSSDENVFRAGRGRLARVGYGSRLVDALFSLSLLARGRVPGDAAAAAANIYKQIQKKNEHYRYYGRVIRQGEWIVVQYWFFYLYNNWRSRFYGANDHESDWEMVCIYLSDRDVTEDDPSAEVDRFRPEWVAYASHDYHGDDLRRRWDDPEVQKVDDHPVIYAGAGSHASYFSRGEYLTELEIPFLAPLVNINERIQRFWHNTMRQYSATAGQNSSGGNIFRIPFVDYARGEGLSIGPGQEREWNEPGLLTPVPAWATQYRGLWGLYARDPFAGENAPAGPMYNRDGTVRKSWYDPLGWAGLDKVPPSDVVASVTHSDLVVLREHQIDLRSEIESKSHKLQSLGVKTAALSNQPHLKKTFQAEQKQIADLSNELDSLRSELAANWAILESLSNYADRLDKGDYGPARAHIQRAHEPASDSELRLSRAAEVWAAISIGVMLIFLVALVYLAQNSDFVRNYIVTGLVAVIALFAFLEAAFRGRLARLITTVTLVMAAVAVLVLLYEFFWPIVVLAILFTGGYILWDNLRELWR